MLDNTNSDPLADVTILLESTDSSGNPNRTATTNGNGQFAFVDVPRGSYRVTASRDNFTFEPESRSITVDAEVTGVDFVATPQLGSTIYGMWNGFLDMTNILEVVNTGQTAMGVKATLFQLDNTNNVSGFVSAQNFSVQANSQTDIIVNDFEGFQKDSYGIVKIDVTSENWDGRLFKYRESKEGYDFAIPQQFRNPIMGTSYVSFNTYRPSENDIDQQLGEIANWLTIANVDPNNAHRFLIIHRAHLGEEISRRTITVPPFGRLDVDGGHVTAGPDRVGLIEIIPEDTDAPYLAHLSRYALPVPELGDDSFQFAITEAAMDGNDRDRFLAVSNLNNSSNWVEAINVSDRVINVDLELFDQNGISVEVGSFRLAPYAQLHFDAGNTLAPNATGLVRLKTSGKILAKSLFYFRDVESRRVLAAYNAPAREAFGMQYVGSYNLFLDQMNWLRIANVTDESVTASYSFASADCADEPAREIFLRPRTRFDILLTEDNVDCLKANTNGVLNIETDMTGSILAEVLRVRLKEDGRFDFTAWTIAQ